MTLMDLAWNTPIMTEIFSYLTNNLSSLLALSNASKAFQSQQLSSCIEEISQVRQYPGMLFQQIQQRRYPNLRSLRLRSLDLIHQEPDATWVEDIKGCCNKLERE